MKTNIYIFPDMHEGSKSMAHQTQEQYMRSLNYQYYLSLGLGDLTPY